MGSCSQPTLQWTVEPPRDGRRLFVTKSRPWIPSPVPGRFHGAPSSHCWHRSVLIVEDEPNKVTVKVRDNGKELDMNASEFQEKGSLGFSWECNLNYVQ